MKNIIFLSAALLIMKGLSAQTYFEQDFNSSNNLTDYFGILVTANKFDTYARTADGGSSADIVGNKLRIIKTTKSGNNRVALNRVLLNGLPSNDPAIGAGFVKFSVEITVSNNGGNGNTTDAPAFFFGPSSSTNLDNEQQPGSRNCFLAVDPRDTEGQFRLRVNDGTTPKADGSTSVVLSGTQTIIAYINDTGNSIIYSDPNNQQRILDNDRIDIWQASTSGGSATLLLNSVPPRDANATQANIRYFKIVSTSNLTANTDIDNIMISEEAYSVLVGKKVASISAVAPIEVPLNTDFPDIPFPETVQVVYDDGTSEQCEVTYSKGGYNKYQVGTYIVTGVVALKLGVINPDQIESSITVSVTPDGTVNTNLYFEQDFNSSGNLADYHGSPVTTNKFDAIITSGNTTAEIYNNKLRVVKAIPSSGNSRVGITRNTLFEGMPETGAGFLKYSMEITVSGNTANVNDGFVFFFVNGASTDVNAPGGTAGRHSFIAIDPRSTEGHFRLRANLSTSEELSGTQTIVSYLNNSGTSVGYMAPDGLPATLDDDMLDIWVVDENGSARLLLGQVPARDPNGFLRNFKLAANPNFAATLDIDNMLFVEEGRIKVKEVVSISAVQPVIVPEKTDFSKIPFTTSVQVTYDDGTVEPRELTYSEADRYNMYQLGEYAVTGTLVPKRGTINPDGITVSTSVIVKTGVNIVNTFTPNGDGKNDVWTVPELQRYTNVSIEVFDRDGKRLFHTTDPNVGWDGKNQNGKIISGSYFYVIDLPPLSLTKKGVLTLIK